jgi:hypothetical protein
MVGCNQPTISDAAFAHLAGIHTLWMNGCNQDTITGATFERLRGIPSLHARGCPAIRDAARAWMTETV